jgi:hypothetical protein
MGLHRVRFTVRGMIVAVAATAIALGAGVWTIELWHLSAHYQELAVIQDRKAHAVTRGSYSDGKGHFFHREWPTPHKDFYLRLKEKYQYAASHPWLPVPRDPPSPES